MCSSDSSLNYLNLTYKAGNVGTTLGQSVSPVKDEVDELSQLSHIGQYSVAIPYHRIGNSHFRVQLKKIEMTR